jgi:hypothetical protein
VMCCCAGHGADGWHFTVCVSVVLPVRTSTQWWPLSMGVKISVRTVTTVTLR